MISKILVVELN